jgi:hypothetical protein
LVEVTASLGFDSFDVRDVRSGSTNVNPKQRGRCILNSAERVRFRAHFTNRSAAQTQCGNVFEGDVFVAPSRCVQCFDAGEIVKRVLADSEGVGPDVSDLLVNVSIETFYQRHDDDYCSNAKDHAQQGQERPQLVAKYRGDSEF